MTMNTRTLNVEEVCSLLKIHCSTLYQKIASGEIPAARIGRSWVFVEEDVIGYVRKQYKKESTPAAPQPAQQHRFSSSQRAAIEELDRFLARKTGKQRKRTAG